MLVLEGRRVSMKSSAAVPCLAADTSRTICLTSPRARRVAALRGKFLIEVSEMHAMTGGRPAHSRPSSAEHRTLSTSFGRREVYRATQCTFIGTTTGDLLKMKLETRFWPVNNGDHQIEALARDLDHLFAEAVHLYQADTHGGQIETRA